MAEPSHADDTSPAYSSNDPVVSQYERWVFPEPVTDLDSPRLAQHIDSFRTLAFLSPAYWPLGQPKGDLDILVGGCGTVAAAAVARFFPACRVVGIDISQASLDHQDRLRQRHSLTNLELRRLPVERAAKLGRKFDYIACHGVLHHLPEPTAGLSGLAAALNPDHGVIALMLYAKYGRAPVYGMQELFGLLNLQQTQNDVGVVRETLNLLPADHPLRQTLKLDAFGVGSDAGLVDMFLHRRDRAYSVSDCLKLVNQAGLVFQGWDNNLFYHPDAFFPKGTQLRHRLDLLDETQLWQAMELLLGRISSHWFFVTGAQRKPETYRIPWDSPQLADWIPLRAAKLATRQGPSGAQYAMAGDNRPAIPISTEQAAILSQMDGRKTAGHCVAAAGLSNDARTLPGFANELLRLMFRTGYGLVCKSR